MPTRTQTLLVATAIALTMLPEFMARFLAAMERRMAVVRASGSSDGSGRREPLGSHRTLCPGDRRRGPRGASPSRRRVGGAAR
jgi:hypothetical protein